MTPNIVVVDPEREHARQMLKARLRNMKALFRDKPHANHVGVDRQFVEWLEIAL